MGKWSKMSQSIIICVLSLMYLNNKQTFHYNYVSMNSSIFWPIPLPRGSHCGFIGSWCAFRYCLFDWAGKEAMVASFPSTGVSPGCNRATSKYSVMGTRIGQLRTEIPRWRYTNFHKSCAKLPTENERLAGWMDGWWVESRNHTRVRHTIEVAVRINKPSPQGKTG